MSAFQNFAISFTIISILAGCLTSYYLAFQWGGPVAVTWGWLIVGGFTIIVALSMAEIASTYPTAGGLYYWSSKLGSARGAGSPGWFNLIGLIGIIGADRLRPRDLRDLALQPAAGATRTTGITSSIIFALVMLAARAVERLRRPHHVAAELDLRLVAHGRRRCSSWSR